MEGDEGVKFLRPHRYGVMLVTTSSGRWYWDEVLMMLTFVATGTRAAKYEHNVRPARNTFVGALRTIADIEERARL